MDEEESLISGTDSEELNNSEAPSLDSDEKAMRDFLAELRKYRRKFKQKTKESAQSNQSKTNHRKNKDPDLPQNPNSRDEHEVIRKKRKRHKLFDPHPPREEEVKVDEPKKVISRKEYNSLMKRLTKKKDDNENTKKQNQQSPKKSNDKQKNSQIFTNLYNQSIEAEKKKKEMIKAQDENEIKELKMWCKPKTCRQSKVYAHNRVIQYVKDTFGKDDTCEDKKLLDILQILGLAENKRKASSLQHFSDSLIEEEEEDNPESKNKHETNTQSKVQSVEDVAHHLVTTFGNGIVCKADQLLNILQRLNLIQITKKENSPQELSSELSDSQKDNIESEISDSPQNTTFYTISNLKKFYLEVANDQISTQFHGIAKEKLLIAMANEKKPSKIDYDPNKQYTTAQSLTRETLDRLVSSKRQKSPEIEPKIENKEEFQNVKLSEGSKKILNESTRKADDDQLLCSLPIDERERHLMKMKNEKIEQMKQEFQSQLIQGRVLRNPFPQYDKETTEKLLKYREYKKNYVEPQPSFRPNLTKYEDFVKKQEELNSSEFRPPQGWEKDISRHRKAYDDFIHLKRLKTEGIDYILECRINARAQLKETNQNESKDANKNRNANRNTIKSTNKNSNTNNETTQSMNLHKNTDQNTNFTKTILDYNLNTNINDDLPVNEQLIHKQQIEENNEDHVHFYFQNNESDDADMED